MLQYFQSFTSYAFRLELLQKYSVEQEIDSYKYFLQHGKLPDQDNSDWHTIIKNASARGACMHRVHMLEFPLSDYIRYEIEAYKESIIAGENILYIDQYDYSESIHQDYRLFDDKIVLKMQYDDDGKYLGYEEITDNIQDYIDAKNRLLSVSKLVKNLNQPFGFT